MNNSFLAGISGTPDFNASIDYERRLLTVLSTLLLARVGAEHTIPDRFNYKAYGFPVGLSLLFGTKKSHLEMSVSFVRIKNYGGKVNVAGGGEAANEAEPNWRATLGYRFQDIFKKGINLRAGLGRNFYSSYQFDYTDSGSDMTAYFTAGYSF